MTKLYKLFSSKKFILLALTGVMAGVSLNYSTGPGLNGAGSLVNASFSAGYCNNCHSGGSFTPSVSVQLLSGSTPVTQYTSSTAYTLRVTVSSSSGVTSNTRYGFQAVSVVSSNNNAINAWGTIPAGVQKVTINTRDHVEHSTKSTTGVFNIPWTSPATTTGNITFYAAGNVVNNDGTTSGDNPTTGSLTVTPNIPCNTPTLSVNTVTNAVCKGGNTGSITINSTGGTTPITYAWSGTGGFTANTQNISGLKAGTYKVIVSAGGGSCKDSIININVTEPSNAFTVSTTGITNVLCKGGSTGAINITTSNGVNPVTYAWTGPGGFNSSVQNVNNLFAGTYKIVATSTGGCKDSLTTVNVTEPANAVAVTANANSPVCVNDTIRLSSTVANATAPITYTWSGPASYASNNQDDIRTPAAIGHAGTYTMSVIDANNCTGSNTVNVLVDSAAMVDTFTFQQGTGADSNKIAFTSVNMRNQTSVLWVFGDGNTATTPNTTHIYAIDDTFDVMLVVSNHCGSDTVKRSVIVKQVSVYDVQLFERVSVYPNPANNTLFIDNKSVVKLSRMTITDVTGRVAMTLNASTGKQTVDVSKLTPGLYYLTIEADNGAKATQKVNIIR